MPASESFRAEVGLRPVGFGVMRPETTARLSAAMPTHPNPIRSLLRVLSWIGLVLVFGEATGAPASLRVVGSAGSQKIEFQRDAGSGRHYVRAAKRMEDLATGYLIGVLPPSGPTTGQVEVPAVLGASETLFLRLESEPPASPPWPGLVWVPAGTYWMGSPADEYGRDDDESPLHEVTISKGFWIGSKEVTQSEYLAVAGTNSSHFTPGNGFATTLEHPVEQVSWSDATNYCALLTRQLQSAGKLAAGLRVRLPTEAEWEYAFRAGTTTAFHSMPGHPNGTNQDILLGNIAWFGGNSDGQTHAVGQKAANGFGLHDMSGNVFEFVQDWFGAYGSGPETNPTGPATGTGRVYRGGSWAPGDTPLYCRASFRFQVSPGNQNNNIGFRAARNP